MSFLRLPRSGGSARRALTIFFCLIFSAAAFVPVPPAVAKTILDLPEPGQMVRLSRPYQPPALNGMTFYPQDPLRFTFLLDPGESSLDDQQLRRESERLIKYFLATLTIPTDDVWVNLSPYEADQITTDALGVTEMGRDMLAQDYLLKQLMASATYPEDELGRRFWQRVYHRAQELYGTTDIPISTFNKVWIVADGAEVYVNGNVVVLGQAHLKVMLEEDYAALQQGQDHPALAGRAVGPADAREVNDISARIAREVLLPEIEREINAGANFARLRQIFHSVILATWYKRNLQTALLNQVYSDRGKIAGVDVDDKTLKDQIYQQYLQTFRQGVYDFIREDHDPATQQAVYRKYFSGGLNFAKSLRITERDTPVNSSPANGLEVDVRLSMLGLEGAAALSSPIRETNAEFDRIRQGLIAALSQPELPTETISTLIADLDRVITAYKNIQQLPGQDPAVLAQIEEILAQAEELKDEGVVERFPRLLTRVRSAEETLAARRRDKEQLMARSAEEKAGLRAELTTARTQQNQAEASFTAHEQRISRHAAFWGPKRTQLIRGLRNTESAGDTATADRIRKALDHLQRLADGRWAALDQARAAALQARADFQARRGAVFAAEKAFRQQTAELDQKIRTAERFVGLWTARLEQEARQALAFVQAQYDPAQTGHFKAFLSLDDLSRHMRDLRLQRGTEAGQTARDYMAGLTEATGMVNTTIYKYERSGLPTRLSPRIQTRLKAWAAYLGYTDPAAQEAFVQRIRELNALESVLTEEEERKAVLGEKLEETWGRPITTETEFGQAMRDRRESRGLSRAVLAAQLGGTPSDSSLVRWERGDFPRQRIRRQVFLDWAAALGLDQEDFWQLFEQVTGVPELVLEGLDRIGREEILELARDTFMALPAEEQDSEIVFDATVSEVLALLDQEAGEPQIAAVRAHLATLGLDDARLLGAEARRLALAEEQLQALDREQVIALIDEQPADLEHQAIRQAVLRALRDRLAAGEDQIQKRLAALGFVEAGDFRPTSELSSDMFWQVMSLDEAMTVADDPEALRAFVLAQLRERTRGRSTDQQIENFLRVKLRLGEDLAYLGAAAMAVLFTRSDIDAAVLKAAAEKAPPATTAALWEYVRNVFIAEFLDDDSADILESYLLYLRPADEMFRQMTALRRQAAAAATVRDLSQKERLSDQEKRALLLEMINERLPQYQLAEIATLDELKTYFDTEIFRKAFLMNSERLGKVIQKGMPDSHKGYEGIHERAQKLEKEQVARVVAHILQTIGLDQDRPPVQLFAELYPSHERVQRTVEKILASRPAARSAVPEDVRAYLQDLLTIFGFKRLSTMTKHPTKNELSAKYVDTHESVEEKRRKMGVRARLNGNAHAAVRSRDWKELLPMLDEVASSPVARTQPPGGIDFNPDKLLIKEIRTGADIPIPIDLEELRQIEFDGLQPVILNIAPAAPVVPLQISSNQ